MSRKKDIVAGVVVPFYLEFRLSDDVYRYIQSDKSLEMYLRHSVISKFVTKQMEKNVRRCGNALSLCPADERMLQRIMTATNTGEIVFDKRLKLAAELPPNIRTAIRMFCVKYKVSHNVFFDFIVRNNSDLAFKKEKLAERG